MYVIKLIDLVWIKARFYPSYFQIWIRIPIEC
jgi:hypothetical protein